MATNHLLIKGKVQGVFFRASAKKLADKLNITGWIRNTEDGNVEAMATGDMEQLQEFIKWCKQGPEKAKVEDVIVTPVKETLFKAFEIIR
jgi:acylphosphatase